MSNNDTPSTIAADFFRVGDRVRVVPDVGDALYEKPLPEGVISAKLQGKNKQGFLVTLDRPVWMLLLGFWIRRPRRILVVPIGPPDGVPGRPGFRQTAIFSLLRNMGNVRNGVYTDSDRTDLGYADLFLVRSESAESGDLKPRVTSSR